MQLTLVLYFKMTYQSSLKLFFQPQSSSESEPPPSKRLRLEDGSEYISVASVSETEQLSSQVDVESQSNIEQAESDSSSDNEEGSTQSNVTNDDCTLVALDGCGNECCASVRNEPYHPKNVIKSKTRQGKQNCSVQNSWFNDYKWLSYCGTNNSVFCFYCRIKCTSGGSTFSTKSNNAFIRGFSNRKKARQKFKEHKNSQAHRESMFSHLASTQPTVISMANLV